jgi:Mg-chelatase subunit ChlD
MVNRMKYSQNEPLIARAGSAARFHRPLALLLALTLVLAAVAQPFAAQAQSAIDTRIDVVLVIDNSGSMDDNDPSGMRISAAKLFANLAAVGDQIGVVSMGERDSTTTLLSLSTIDDFTQFGWDRLKTIKAPDELASYTYMGEALDLASQVMDNAAKRNRERAVIFLTDGLPTYLDEDRAAQEAKQVAAVEKLRNDGVKIFPIALGPAADRDWLHHALAVPTGGRVWPADNADQLLGVYTTIMTLLQDGRYVDTYDVIGNVETFLANVNPRQQINQVNFVFPGKDNTAPVIEELLLPNTPTSGKDKLSRFQDPNWAMFTARPEYIPRFNGEWRVELQAQQSQVPMIAVIKSDLRARLVEPIPSVADDEVSTRYYPAGRSLMLRAGARNKADLFEKRLGVWVKMQEPDMGDGFELQDVGMGQDLVAEDGIRAGLYDRALSPGNYRLLVNISPTDSHLRLDKIYDLTVEPLPMMEVSIEPEGQIQVNEPVQIKAHFAYEGQRVEVQAAEIEAAVKLEDKVVEVVTLERQDDGSYVGEYVPPRSDTFSFALTAHVEWNAPDRGYRRYTDYVEVGYDVSKQPLVEVAVVDAGDRVAGLEDGVQRTVEFRSYSDEPVEIKLSIAGIPEGSVFPDTITIQPRETGSRTVTLNSPSELRSGEYQAQLKVETTPGVRLSTTDLPVSFTVTTFLERNRWVMVLAGLIAFLLIYSRTRRGIADFFVRNVELLRYGGR